MSVAVVRSPADPERDRRNRPNGGGLRLADEVHRRDRLPRPCPAPRRTGGDLIITDHSAGEALGGHRGVIVGNRQQALLRGSKQSGPFQPGLGDHAGAAAQDGTPAIVRVGGKMTEPSWNWDLDKFIYLGTNGLLTQTPPAAGFLLEMGWPINPTTILVDIKLPVLLA